MSNWTITLNDSTNNEKVTAELTCSSKSLLAVSGYSSISENLPASIIDEIDSYNSDPEINIEYVMVAYVYSDGAGSTTHEIAAGQSYFTMDVYEGTPENSIFYIFDLSTGIKAKKRPKGKTTFGLGGV